MSRPSVLKELLSLYDKHDGFKQQLEMYSRQVDAKEFAFFRDMLLTMKGVMMSDVFSHSFSELGAADKDVMQRTYYQLNQWLDFMLGPMKVINAKKSRLVQMNPTRGKATPSPQGKEK
jgi:hypothetical protein